MFLTKKIKEHDEKLDTLAKSLEQLIAVVKGNQEALRLTMTALKKIGIKTDNINKN